MPRKTRKPSQWRTLVGALWLFVGVHHFYLGDRRRGFRYLAFFWTGSRGDDSTLPKLKSSNIPIFYSPQRLAHGITTSTSVPPPVPAGDSCASCLVVRTG